jgi:GT2 family glycosyltransferase
MIGFNIIGAEKPAERKEFYKAVKIKTRSFNYSENYVCGCAMFVTRFLIERIGSFDPIYFAYEEEIDWGKRAKKAGFKIANVDVPIYHNLASTSKKIFLKASFFQIRNTIRCSIKNDSIFQIIRRCIAVINTACNPFKKVDKKNAIFVRLRPFNPIINLILVVNAFFWNAFFLPQTLYSRWTRFTSTETNRYKLNNNI